MLLLNCERCKGTEGYLDGTKMERKLAVPVLQVSGAPELMAW